MNRGKGRRFLRSLQEGGKVLLSSIIGVLSLLVNSYMVWTSRDWSGQPYYELYTAIITVTAATAAVGIATVIYAPEVSKVFGETFLAKRYKAGREDGLEEGREEGLEEGVERGREERDAEVRAELRRLLAENPETFADQVKDWLGNGAGPRNGKEPGPGPRG